MPLSRSQLIGLVEEYAVAYGIDPAIAVAQLSRESANFRSDVVYGPFVGAAGERGIAQFIPGTWAQWGAGGNPYNPDDSLYAWGEFMTYLLGRYWGDVWKALAAYNGGPGNVDRGTISQAAQNYATEVLAQAGPSPQQPYNPNTVAVDSLAAPSSQESSLFWPLTIGAGILIFGLIISDN